MMPPSLLLDRLLGAHADAARGDDEVAVLIAVLGDGLGEDQLASAPPLLLPRLAGTGLGGEHCARGEGPVVLVVLLGVQGAGIAATGATPASAAPGARRIPARAEPRRPDLGPQRVVRIELRARLDE